MTTKEIGDIYEGWVLTIIHAVIAESGEKFTIQPNVKRWGYQIDVLCSNSSSVIIVECKNYGTKIQHEKIDAFISKVSRIQGMLGKHIKVRAIFITKSFFFENVIDRIYNESKTVFNTKYFNYKKQLDLLRIEPIVFGNHILIYDYTKTGMSLKSLAIAKADFDRDFHENVITSINSPMQDRINSSLELLSNISSKEGNSLLIAYESLSNSFYHTGSFENSYMISRYVEENIKRIKAPRKSKSFYGMEAILVEALAKHSAAKNRGLKYPAKDFYYKLKRAKDLNLKEISKGQMIPIDIFLGEWLSRYTNEKESGIKLLKNAGKLAYDSGNSYMNFTAFRKMYQVTKDDQYLIRAEEVVKDLKGNFQVLALDFLEKEKGN